MVTSFPANLETVCLAAYHGHSDKLKDAIESYMGDLNVPLTNVSALHMASMNGHSDCVKLLLDAKADPLVRSLVLSNKDDVVGVTAQDQARAANFAEIADLLAAAEAAAAQAAAVTKPPAVEVKEPEPAAVKAAVVQEKEEEKPKPEEPAAVAPVIVEEKKPAQIPRVLVKDPVPVSLLFPGQGSQYVGMLEASAKIPAVKEMLDKADKILGFDLLKLCKEGPEDKLGETRFCQPALFVAGLAGMEALRVTRPEAVEKPQCVAGLSLGEYTALCAADVIDFEDALHLVKLRGEAMQEAAQMSEQSMISIAGLERSVLDGLCKKAREAAGPGEVSQVANCLFPKGFACAGTKSAIAKLEKLAMDAGALQAKLLKTSGGFHTSLMLPAKERLEVALATLAPKFRSPRCDIYLNVTAGKTAAGSDPSGIAKLLAEQLVSPVMWHETMDAMIKDGVSEMYECGPQKQLKAMMKRINMKMWKNVQNVE